MKHMKKEHTHLLIMEGQRGTEDLVEPLELEEPVVESALEYIDEELGEIGPRIVCGVRWSHGYTSAVLVPVDALVTLPLDEARAAHEEEPAS